MKTSNAISRLAILAMTLGVSAGAFAAAPATDAHAAEHADDHGAAVANPMAFEIVPFVSTLIVFGIVFFILSSKVWPKISGALQAREDKIRTEIEEAERSRRQANAALQQYEKALAEARTEASRIVEQTKAEQQKLASQLRSKTESELNALREGALRDIEAAKRAAISEIYSQMAGTATSIASKILARELNPADQGRLVAETLDRIEAVRSN